MTNLFRSRKFLRFSSSVIFFEFSSFSGISSSSSESSLGMVAATPLLALDFLLAGALAGGSFAFRRPLVVTVSVPPFLLPFPRVLGRTGSVSSDKTLPASLMPRAEPDPMEPPELAPFICGAVLGCCTGMAGWA